MTKTINRSTYTITPGTTSFIRNGVRCQLLRAYIDDHYDCSIMKFADAEMPFKHQSSAEREVRRYIQLDYWLDDEGYIFNRNGTAPRTFKQLIDFRGIK